MILPATWRLIDDLSLSKATYDNAIDVVETETKQKNRSARTAS